LSPSSLVEFRLGITKSIGGKWPVQIGLPNIAGWLWHPWIANRHLVGGRPEHAGDRRLRGLRPAQHTPQFQNPLVINPKVNYSKILTRHTLKLGWELQTIHTEVLDFSPQYGQDSYSGQFSAPPALPPITFTT